MHKGISDFHIESRKFKDPKKVVNEQCSEFEIDVYCEKPWIVAEITSFLNEKEFDKVVKLTRIKKFLVDRKRKKGYFFLFFVFVKFILK